LIFELQLAGLLLEACESCPDKIAEELMRTSGTTFKLLMKLCRDKPGMVWQFDNLNLAIVSRTTTHDHAVGFNEIAKFVVEFVAMAVALKDDRFTVGLSSFCAWYKATELAPHAHGATFVSHLTLRWH
jgi:hypothetical protein